VSECFFLVPATTGSTCETEVVTFRVSHARLSVPRRIPPGCKSVEWYGVSCSCALLGGFAIGARVSLLQQHSVEHEMSAGAMYSLYASL